VSAQQPDSPPPIRIVITDANVLYSRVLRDYLLYAAEYRLIAVAWSREIPLAGRWLLQWDVVRQDLMSTVGMPSGMVVSSS